MTYPNVLVMSYLKDSGQLTPEWQAKLETALNLGWQRLLTFEAKGGGFDWYPDGQARTILTAYAAMQLTDMNRVYPIDTSVVDRAIEILKSRQNRDGSWDLDTPMHTWYGLSRGNLPMTAYITWALKECGRQDAFVMKGSDYVLAHFHESEDPYILALCALALGENFPASMLEEHAVLDEGAARWKTDGEGLVHARGKSASIEATAMAALALQRNPGSTLADKALTALIRDKDPSGAWHSTQSTILAIKALLEGARGPRPAARDVTVTLRVNGREITGAFAAIGKGNSDVCQQAEIPVEPGETTVELEMSGDLRATFQVAGRYYTLAPAPETGPRLIDIATEYNRDDIALGDEIEATTTLTYRGPETFMVIADLGIPPGFDPDPASFDALVQARKLDKYSLTGRQITLYFGRVDEGQTITVNWTLRPRFPIRAQAPRDRAFEYYTPQNEATGAARRIIVRSEK